jgi:hypothetical protein
MPAPIGHHVFGQHRHKRRASDLSGTDLGGVKVLRKAYDDNVFVGCEHGHEFVVTRVRVLRYRDKRLRMECRDCVAVAK